MDEYRVGNGNEQIKMAVDIDTFGLAATRVFLVDLSTQVPGVPVGHSLDATGDISRKDIGTPGKLVNKRLAAFTKIDLVGDDTFRKKESERLSGKLTLLDGAEGLKEFTFYKTISDNYTSVLLDKKIDLTV